MDVHGRFTNYLLRLLPILILLILPAPSFSSQVQTPPSGQKGEKSDKAVRAGVGLVQTDVLVFDRQGRFADDLNGTSSNSSSGENRSQSLSSNWLLREVPRKQGNGLGLKAQRFPRHPR